MKTLFGVIVLFACLAGCSPLNEKPMTNDEIIRETKKCTDAGLDPVALYGWDNRIYAVECTPKRKP